MRIAVAANFHTTLEKLITAYKQQNSILIELSTASTGLLYAQIKHGAPFDLFFAADKVRPRKLISEGLVYQDKLQVYALGRAVLWTTKQPYAGKIEDLKDSAGRLAIADPNLAPYGAAAKQWLIDNGVWKDLTSRLVYGRSVGQAFQFAATGNVRFAVVAYSQWLSLGGDSEEVIIMPDRYAELLSQAAVILNSSHQTQSAKMFLSFIKSDAGQKIITNDGYYTTSHNVAENSHSEARGELVL